MLDKVGDGDDLEAVLTREFHELGFEIIATDGTADWFNKYGVPATRINKVGQGSPHIVDALRAGKIQLMVNTPLGAQAYDDGAQIRSVAYQVGVPLVTTMSAAAATLQGIKSRRRKPFKVRSLQEHHVMEDPTSR